MRAIHVALTLAFAGCVGTIGNAGSEGAATGSSSSTGGGGAGGANADGGSFTASLMATRVRRLTNAEFDATAHALLGTSQSFAATFAQDVRQGSFIAGGFQAAGFTRNAAAIFDAVSTPLVQTAANSLANEAVANNLSTLAPCSDPNPTNCATTFINTFGARAFRRPVTSDELTGLLGVFQAGLQDQNYAGGIQLVIATILQSAGFPLLDGARRERLERRDGAHLVRGGSGAIVLSHRRAPRRCVDAGGGCRHAARSDYRRGAGREAPVDRERGGPDRVLRGAVARDRHAAGAPASAFKFLAQRW